MTEEMDGWTIYKVKTLSRRPDHLPNLEVIEIEFNSNADRASLITKNYPLLLVQNQQGQILWSVNWQNSKITETHNATSHNDIISLGQVAQKNKSASVPIEELDTLINNTIGPKARKKK